MREKIYLLLGICGLLFILALLSSVRAADSTKVPRINPTVKQMRCYGDPTATYVKNIGISCSDNQNNTGCPSSSFIYGYTYQCTGGDAWTSCSSHCSVQCGTPTSPDTNCDWK